MVVNDQTSRSGLLKWELYWTTWRRRSNLDPKTRKCDGRGRQKQKEEEEEKKTNVRSWERDLGERQQLLSKHDQTRDLSFLWHDCERCSTSDPVLLSRHVYTSPSLPTVWVLPDVSVCASESEPCLCVLPRVVVGVRKRSSCAEHLAVERGDGWNDRRESDTPRMGTSN